MTTNENIVSNHNRKYWRQTKSPWKWNNNRMWLWFIIIFRNEPSKWIDSFYYSSNI